jgi:di- and tripeptidase
MQELHLDKCDTLKKPTSYFFSEKTHESYFHPSERNNPPPIIEIPSCQSFPFAHLGYIYSMLSKNDKYLITGGGEGAIHIWDCVQEGIPKKMFKLLPATGKSSNLPAKGRVHEYCMEDVGGVISLCLVNAWNLVAGYHGGAIRVWDLESRQCIRILIEHEHDVIWMHSLYLETQLPLLISVDSGGDVNCWAYENAYTVLISCNLGIEVLSAGYQHHRLSLVDNHGKCMVWQFPMDSLIQEIKRFKTAKEHFSPEEDFKLGHFSLYSHYNDALYYTLRNWMPICSISGDPDMVEQCHLGAQYIKSIISQLGADSMLLPSDEGLNPVVLGRFFPQDKSQKDLPHIVFYGHYDIVPVTRSQWEINPFQLTGRNGFFYGRGVSDNKGPILAALFAVAELYEKGALSAMVTFLIEGEEERGSNGLRNCIETHHSYILGPMGTVDVILMSNGCWLDEVTPCVTFGQRGVIHASISVECDEMQSDRHAGVYGGAVAAEPLPDLIYLISSLSKATSPSDTRVQIPGFYSEVAPVSPQEDCYLESLAVKIVGSEKHSGLETSHGNDQLGYLRNIEETKASLIHKWRTPTLTVSNIVTSGGSKSISVIPRRATATVSIRTVPHQSSAVLVEHLKDFLNLVFNALKQSRPHTTVPNLLHVDVSTIADPWLDSPSNPLFQSVSAAVTSVWKAILPLEESWAVREGGSTIPLHWLRRRLSGIRNVDVPVVNIPLAQANDGSHLANERIKVLNLFIGREALRESIRNVQERLHFEKARTQAKSL